jgi:hypothetical protein
MNIEIWKEITNFSNYEISNYGNIKNKYNQHILNPQLVSSYFTIGIIDDNGNRKSLRIHRLVALMFIPNPHNKYTVNHINHIKTDNHVKNLEWMTQKEQNNHSIKNAKPQNNRQVWRVNKDTNEKLELYKSIKIASKWVIDNKLTSSPISSISSSKISAVASGKRITSYGYKWQYEDENKYEYKYPEEWKDIPFDIINGGKGYKISNYGRIKNYNGRIHVGSNHNSGYIIFKSIYLIHRLVAQVFIPNPDNKKCVNHKDGNKKNNNINNLEWNTMSENSQHAHDTGLNPTKKPIIQYDINMNKIKEFNTHIQASKELNISRICISKCCRGIIKSTKGFIFKYK